MPPDFSKATVELLAKRAAYICGNPDCRTSTAGPGKSPGTAVIIGEGCHIYGARPNAKRHNPGLSKYALAEASNGIWLCRNCHKIVDSDESRHSAELLFEWRSLHDQFVLAKLGTQSERILADQRQGEFEAIYQVSPRAWAIAKDQEDFWEYRLTAELIRAFLESPLERWQDLQDGLYTKQFVHLSDREVLPWTRQKTREALALLGPITKIVTERLQPTWGDPGEPGDAERIFKICLLLGQACERIVDWEEANHSIFVADELNGLIDCFKSISGSHLQEIMRIAEELDKGVDWAEANPGERRTKQIELVIRLPDDWAENTAKEMRAAERYITDSL